MSENLDPFELPTVQATITEHDDGTNTVAFRERAEPGELEIHQDAAGHYVVTPLDPAQRLADEADLMAHGFPPSWASSPWFVQRMREESDSE